MWWPNLDDWKRNLCKDNHSTIDLNLMWNQSTCRNASIALSGLPIMMQTQIQPTNTRWGETTLKSLQPCIVPMLNTTIATIDSHIIIAKQKYDDQFWTTWREIFAIDDHPTIDLNLMNNQSTCLNASITLSVLPIMMQTQIRATNMRWGGTTLKSLQPCLVPMPNTTICHNWLSHYNCLTEM